ncbi:FAD-dependent oxidoreductase [Bradyrhizobium sp. BWA-3-5]|uniref:oxidoreductase n=1 Tax=Bradyrhizobium sp. BWA-3-5 TaxID=3080013 RepID=UPI00293EAF58|nr:FAD-dependent oxidoreductase [Bradyrhizobium sp. BWA-3-5]WOH63713.1 FAD-dependent oxidoreductase [Bradyrhizobium sp. BWA-3-5]
MNLKSPARERDPLLRPFQIKGMRLRNRIISTSHSATLDGKGLPLERYQSYHEEKAKGGLALTMIGGSSMIGPDSSWGGHQLDISSDLVVPMLQRLADRVHQHGAAVGIQISHLGRRAEDAVHNWLPAIGPSRMREMRHRSISREMDQHDIDRVISEYGLAARRAREGGMDCLETLTGGHIIGQFFSPRTNFRTDRFGGTIENRARFGLMVHEEIRRRIGDDFVVGIRFVVDEESPEGLNFEDCLEIARIFEREGLVDFFNCNFGRVDSPLSLAKHAIPNMAQPLAPFLKPVAAFKRETKLPVFHAARIHDLATARFAIANNMLDLVGMTRAHIADPHIVNKLLEGQEDRIRPCVGASHCTYRLVTCIHNASSGRETFLPHVVPRSSGPRRKIVVVGGGPAGMEAARVLGERGHRVTLFEAAGRLGGQVLLATRASWRRDLIAIVDWRISELARLGVDVRTNSYVNEPEILAEQPDVVIVATGGVPDIDGVEGGNHCASTWDVLSEPNSLKDDIIVFDGTGRHEASSTALQLAETGHLVRFLTLDNTVSQEMEYLSQVSYREKMAKAGVKLYTDFEIRRVERRGNQLAAVFRHVLTDETVELVASQIVIERGTRPVDEVFQALRDKSTNDGHTNLDELLRTAPQPNIPSGDGKFALFRIGDAVSSRGIHAAIYDAFRLCITM